MVGETDGAEVYVPRVLPAGETQNCTTNGSQTKAAGVMNFTSISCQAVWSEIIKRAQSVAPTAEMDFKAC